MDNRILTRISDAELERRWTALRREMAARNIEALVVQSSNDWMGGYVKWLTDIPATNGYPRSVVLHRDEPMTVVGMGPLGARQDFSGHDPIQRGTGLWLGSPAFLSVCYTHHDEGKLVAADLLRRGYRRIGLVGAGGMAHGFVATIQTALDGKLEILDATDWVDAIKTIKSPEEQKLLRASAELQDKVFARVLSEIRPGMRDIDVTALAQYTGQILGSEQGIFLGGSAPTGQRANFLSRYMQGRTLEKGDHLTLLIEVNGPGGFFTEIARTVVLGRVSNELREGFAAMREAQEHTLSLLQPGAACAAIAASHNDYMRAHGLPIERRLYAHSQGYDMVERPLIRHDETMTLAAGTCLAVHPGYETETMFAVICDNYIVSEAGAGACLHKTEKKIFELE
jgi:Xaa-Pro aminopeptidase